VSGFPDSKLATDIRGPVITSLSGIQKGKEQRCAVARGRVENRQVNHGLLIFGPLVRAFVDAMVIVRLPD